MIDLYLHALDLMWRLFAPLIVFYGVVFVVDRFVEWFYR